jgi:hypothetical protein
MPLLRISLGGNMRRYIVEIEIDETEGNSFFQDNISGDPSRFRIVIRKDPEMMSRQNEQLINLTHELGHMVGTIFRTPGMIHDPRSFNPIGLQGIEYDDLVFSSEKEAWRHAELITDFQDHRRRCLYTYETKFNLKHFYLEVK